MISPFLPDLNSNVFFTANTASNLSTTLDNSFTINSLTFTGTGTSNTAGTTIAPGTGGIGSGNTLTINAAAVSAGITVQTGSGPNTISANLALGSSQAWVINASSLTVSSVISDGGSGFSLTKLGAGVLTLSGNNTYSGGMTIASGTLNINAQGTGPSNSAIGTGPLTLTSGSIDVPAGPIDLTGTTNNPMVWSNSGSVAFTGTNTLNLGTGAVTLGIDATAATFTLTNNSTLTGTSLTVGGSITSGTGGTAGGKTLVIGGPGSTALTGNITPGTATSVIVTDTSSGTLKLTGNNAITTLNVNGGANSIVDLGAGTTTFNNAGLSFVESTTGGTVNATGGGSIVLNSKNGGSTVDFGDNGTAAGTTLTINAKITGGFGFEVFNGGGGTVVLANLANSFTGDVNIDGGILSVSSIGNVGSTTSNLGAGTNISINGGSLTNNILRYTGSGETTNRVINLYGTTGGGTIDQEGTGPLKFTANLATPGLGAKTFFLIGSPASSLATGEIAGIIKDNGTAGDTTAVLKTGTGTWILSAANTYTGATTVDQGTLSMTVDQSLGGLVFGAAATSTNFGSLNLTGANAAFTSLNVQNNNATPNTVTLGSTKTLTVNGAVSVATTTATAASLNSNLSVSGGAFVANLGTGALTVGYHNLTAVPTGTGVTGTLDLSGAASVNILGSTNASSILLGSNTTQTAAGTVADTALGTLKLSAAGANTITVGTITLGNSPVSGTAGIQGFLTLGNSTNTLNVDTLYVAHQKSQINGTTQDVLSFAGTGGTLTLGGFTNGTKNTLNIAYNDVAATGTISVGKVDLSGGTFNGKLASLNVGFTNAATAVGGGQGTFIMANGTTTADVVALAVATSTTLSNTTGVFTLTGGSFTLAAAGAGINQVGATTNTTYGNATVNLSGTGDLELNNSPVSLPGAGSIFNFSGGTLGNISTFAVAGLTNLTDSGGLLARNAAGTTTLGTLAFTGSGTSPAALVSAGTLSIGGSGITSTNPNSAVRVEGGALNLNSHALAAGSLFFRSGTISNIAAAGATLNSTTNPLLVLQDTNVNFPVALSGGPTASTAGDVHFENTTGGGSGGTISGNLNLGAVTRVINVDDSAAALIDLTVSGQITNGGLTKSGSGVLSITSTGNSYSGGTTINAGTMLANSTAATGPAAVTVAAAGTLGGTGTIAGPATISGVITAGTGATVNAVQGRLALTAPTGNPNVWNAGGTYAWKLNTNNAGSPGALNSEATPGSNWDVLTMSSLSSPGSFNVQVIGLGTGSGASPFDPTQTYQWVAGTVPAAALTGAGSSTAFNLPSPQGFSGYSNLGLFSAVFQADPTITGQEDLVVNYSPTPEPGSLSVLGLGAGLLMLRRRRRRLVGR